jgi:hypothetical protein
VRNIAEFFVSLVMNYIFLTLLINSYFLTFIDDDLFFSSDHGPQSILRLRLVESLHKLNGRTFLFGGETTTKKV